MTRILYAFQGTGNGHLSRANALVPILQEYGEVDLLVSGTDSDIGIDFPIKYQCFGIGFYFGKKGGINLLKTILHFRPLRFLLDVFKLPTKHYDLIINDFEPISAWAAKLRGKPCWGLSHQWAVTHKNSPKPSKSDFIAQLVLRYYAPASFNYGFHFMNYADGIFQPVIREEIKSVEVSEDGDFVIYLPAYSAKHIIDVCESQNAKFKIFSKDCKTPYESNNCYVYPVNGKDFIDSLGKCKGLICGGGFEGPSEALYLKKRLLVIPMKNQYEQHCNAAALKQMGVSVIPAFSKKWGEALTNFTQSKNIVHYQFRDQKREVIKKIIAQYEAQLAGDFLVASS